MLFIFQRGAEAELHRERYLGMEALAKERIEKRYRNRALDEKIRKRRTKEECLLLSKAKEQGVRTPVIYSIDMEGKRIVMEFVRGERLKDSLNAGNVKLCREVGRLVGKLHKAGIVHGDLTTSNIIVKDGKLVFVDFGLGSISKRIEDFATDLLVFKKTYSATHFGLPEGWNLIQKGYMAEFGRGRAVFEKLGEIEKRARYM